MTRDKQGRFVSQYQDATQIDPSLARPKLEPCREAGCPRRTKLAQGYCHVHRGPIMRAQFSPEREPVRTLDHLDVEPPLTQEELHRRTLGFLVLGTAILSIGYVVFHLSRGL